MVRNIVELYAELNQKAKVLCNGQKVVVPMLVNSAMVHHMAKADEYMQTVTRMLVDGKMVEDMVLVL